MRFRIDGKYIALSRKFGKESKTKIYFPISRSIVERTYAQENVLQKEQQQDGIPV